MNEAAVLPLTAAIETLVERCSEVVTALQMIEAVGWWVTGMLAVDAIAHIWSATR